MAIVFLFFFFYSLLLFFLNGRPFTPFPLNERILLILFFAASLGTKMISTLVLIVFQLAIIQTGWQGSSGCLPDITWKLYRCPATARPYPLEPMSLHLWIPCAGWQYLKVPHPGSVDSIEFHSYIRKTYWGTLCKQVERVRQRGKSFEFVFTAGLQVFRSGAPLWITLHRMSVCKFFENLIFYNLNMLEIYLQLSKNKT